jgi:hypothetical protein
MNQFEVLQAQLFLTRLDYLSLQAEHLPCWIATDAIVSVFHVVKDCAKRLGGRILIMSSPEDLFQLPASYSVSKKKVYIKTAGVTTQSTRRKLFLKIGMKFKVVEQVHFKKITGVRFVKLLNLQKLFK